MSEIIIVLSTCASAEEAGKIARLLVERRLAACVNVVPGVRSYYRWKGAVETAGEWMLVIKSSRRLFSELSAELKAANSYQTPECIALPLADGSEAYLNWVTESLSQEGPR
jgi:periplasmic divalent cation tolerance protein